MAAAGDFPGWLRATHLLNVLFLTLLVRSGLEILSSFPKLYWTDHCTPGREWLRLTRRPLPQGRSWTALEEEEEWSPWLALPGGSKLGLGRHWHFAAVLGWVVTGTAYVALLFAADEWRRLVPTSWSVFGNAWDDLITYLSFALPPPGDPYGPLQQLAYFGIVFLLAPLTIATGAAMSPALAGRFPGYVRLFGGKQIARSLHFACLAGFVLFTVVHTMLVVLHGLPAGLAAVLLDSETGSHRLAILLGALTLVLVLAANVLATVGTRAYPRRAQRALGALVDPIQRALSHRLVSNQVYEPADISPYLRINGRPPAGDPYAEHAGSGFRKWRLNVGGLVQRPLSLSLKELRQLERREQVTKHNCIQGWSGVAAWSGVPLALVLDLCVPLSEASYLVLYAFDDKALTGVGAEPRTGLFYGAIDLALARQPQTILAYEFNGEPLPVERGAPLRLRLENQLGFKMVKWIDRIELVASFSEVGEGQGGWK
ncbi:MAG: molybdopterin-dependent oxidoreductase, partial [Propionibacteriales bacterium]|nr:molybdopterin-dependent oxidoreductase [Propionibacteriales bacterium]